MTKTTLPKGFLSKGGYPTLNAVTMFMTYLRNGGTVNDKTPNEFALTKVRDFFNYHEPNSFKMMVHWGLSTDCLNSETSKERAIAMRKAKVLAYTLIEETR